MPCRTFPGQWLLSRCRPEGGFFASPMAPLPDLLSTATALHALDAMRVDLGPWPSLASISSIAFGLIAVVFLVPGKTIRWTVNTPTMDYLPWAIWYTDQNPRHAD